jgi:hypothetical protein
VDHVDQLVGARNSITSLTCKFALRDPFGKWGVAARAEAPAADEGHAPRDDRQVRACHASKKPLVGVVIEF